MATTLEQAFAAFVQGVEARGPSVRDFGLIVGLNSASHGHYWIKQLVAAGVVERIPGARVYETRPYRLTAKGKALAQQKTVEGYTAIAESVGARFTPAKAGLTCIEGCGRPMGGTGRCKQCQAEFMERYNATRSALPESGGGR